MKLTVSLGVALCLTASTGWAAQSKAVKKHKPRPTTDVSSSLNQSDTYNPSNPADSEHPGYSGVHAPLGTGSMGMSGTTTSNQPTQAKAGNHRRQ